MCHNHRTQGREKFPCDCKYRSEDENENSYNAIANVFTKWRRKKKKNNVHNKLIFSHLSLVEAAKKNHCTLNVVWNNFLKPQCRLHNRSLLQSTELKTKFTRTRITVINKRNICYPIERAQALYPFPSICF